MNKSFIKYQVFVFVSVILIAVDQITKKLALRHLFNNKPYVIIDNVLELTYVENRGAAFGILQNKQKMFYILTIIVLIVICYLLYKIGLDLLQGAARQQPQRRRCLCCFPARK